MFSCTLLYGAHKKLFMDAATDAVVAAVCAAVGDVLRSENVQAAMAALSTWWSPAAPPTSALAALATAAASVAPIEVASPPIAITPIAVTSPPTVPPIAGEAIIPLWASEVGSYMGEDSWHPRCKSLGRVWRRTNDAHFMAVLDAWKSNGRQFGSASSSAAPNLADPFPDVRNAADVAAFRKGCTPADALRLYKTKGHLFEDSLAAMLGEELGQPVELRNTAVSWRADSGATASIATSVRPPGEITDPGVFTIVGEVDGWLLHPPHANTIVELKLRMQRLPPSPPRRDVAQVQTYMAIYDVNETLYVQSVLGTEEIHVTKMSRDRRAWETEMLPSIRQFVCDIRRLLRGDVADMALRHEVLNAVDTDYPQMRVIPPVPDEVFVVAPKSRPAPATPPPPLKVLPPVPAVDWELVSTRRRRVKRAAPASSATLLAGGYNLRDSSKRRKQ